MRELMSSFVVALLIVAGVGAQSQSGSWATPRNWFDRSVTLAPRQDLSFTYPCTVLTQEVEAELSERMRKLAAK